ncbi:MAG: acyl-CoA dehydrogenase family protein [Actinobacteria bacterium]|nr:acyl-CoA dehydrogenase family protein [Actinomycetota bacterium]MBU4240477.1 acyl-CoA dehydrogenase family protein [Actinomycetota bacterium]MBU4301373.1 acyl-CoA dehydrogenase family protein [Actinomycetota bacterium]MBU4386260.1 acyl-CoA dehydrogenase family protein [Actinomycetota bacterium]MBU4489698.1 acyl-CoA dehydrogenase family protein [Actinomycetota bacterium]
MFTEEHDMLRQSVRDFAEKEVAPYVDEWEENETYDMNTFKKMGDLGFLGLRVPEEYGGGGTDYWSVVVLFEEMIRAGSSGFLTAIGVHTEVAIPAIMHFGTEEQKQKYLVPAVKGESLGALAVTEPEAGSDVASMRATAVEDGDSYIINGNKIFISNGARADWIIVAAKTDKEGGYNGITELIVDTDTPGFEVSRKLDKVGLRSCDTAELFFTDMRVPKENMLGELNKGFHQIMANFQPERLLVAIGAYGGAEAALQLAIDYAKERVQFGKPISKQQHNAFKIAELATKIEASKELSYRAADMYNRGVECMKEVMMAKLYTTDVANEVAYEAMQLMGGYGYMMEYPIQRAWRDLRVMTIVAGTNEIMKLIISRNLGL